MILRPSKTVPPPEDKVQLKMEQQQGAGHQATEKEEHIKKFTEPHQQMEIRSRSSRSSSKRSSTSSAAMRARAKAVAARAQIAYAEKEANMIKQKGELEASMLRQKADLDTSLHILQVERAAAVASAEAAAYEEDEEELESGKFYVKPVPDMQPVNVAQRTCEYVQQHARESFTELPFNDEPLETKVKTPLFSVAVGVDHTLLVPSSAHVYKPRFTNQKTDYVKKETENENDVKRTSFYHSS